MLNAYHFQLQSLCYYLNEACLSIAPDREFLEENEYEEEIEKLDAIENLDIYSLKTIEQLEKQVFFLAEYLKDWFPDDFDEENRESYYNSILNEVKGIQEMTKDVSLEFCIKHSKSIAQLEYIAEHNQNLSDTNRDALSRYIKLKTMFSA